VVVYYRSHCAHYPSPHCRFRRHDPIGVQDFIKTIVDHIYGPSGSANLHTLHPHRLSVFFIILATGVLYDDDKLSSILAERYHALARAALSLESILVEASCAAVQALFMIVRYIDASNRTCNETRWMLSGLCCRLSQTVSTSIPVFFTLSEIFRIRRLVFVSITIFCTRDCCNSLRA
jgi:hypothetical protein